MYLRNLRLENVKLLGDQDFSFVRADGSPRLWTVLIGDNGLCKTTVLQAIGLAASGDKQATSLVADAATFRRVTEEDREVLIGAEFSATDKDLPHAGKVELRLPKGWHEFRADNGSQWISEVRGQRLPGYFVAGYGVGRFLPKPGEVVVPSDFTQDRVRSLFDHRHQMLGTDFFEALKKGDKAHLRYAKQLRAVLLAEDSTGATLLPGLSRFELRGRGGVRTNQDLLAQRRFELDVEGESFKLPIQGLSHGYQSTIAWIADLLGHAFLDSGGPVEAASLRGVVLIDEIDLHLHPSWQRRLVPTLKAAFPCLQFVATTHSPLVLTGLEADEIVRLRFEGTRVVQAEEAVEPGLLDASALLTSYFSVPRAGRPELVELEREYLNLRGLSKPSAKDKARMAELAGKLERYWGGDVAEDAPENL